MYLPHHLLHTFENPQLRKHQQKDWWLLTRHAHLTIFKRIPLFSIHLVSYWLSMIKQYYSMQWVGSLHNSAISKIAWPGGHSVWLIDGLPVMIDKFQICIQSNSRVKNIWKKPVQNKLDKPLYTSLNSPKKGFIIIKTVSTTFHTVEYISESYI